MDDRKGKDLGLSIAFGTCGAGVFLLVLAFANASFLPVHVLENPEYNMTVAEGGTNAFGALVFGIAVVLGGAWWIFLRATRLEKDTKK